MHARAHATRAHDARSMHILPRGPGVTRDRPAPDSLTTPSAPAAWGADADAVVDTELRVAEQMGSAWPMTR